MSQNDTLSDFLSFKKFISRTLIIVVYLIGALWTTISGFIYMFKRTEIPFIGRYSGGSTQILVGLAIIIIGNITWRIICEIAIVLFSIQDSLKEIENNTDRMVEEKSI
ncbi:MAG: DUF4282 domain-containing protein [Acidobacteriota bacterium]|nr:DUF4282 domain-containing protein [Acidobacteriota bacterium]